MTTIESKRKVRVNGATFVLSERRDGVQHMGWLSDEAGTELGAFNKSKWNPTLIAWRGGEATNIEVGGAQTSGLWARQQFGRTKAQAVRAALEWIVAGEGA